MTYPNFEILVCDMNSEEDPSQLIHNGNYQKTKLYKSTTNLGFAGGNNWGINHAKGEYILFINNDTEVTPDLIELLLMPFQLDSSTGVVCPKIKFYSEKNKIQYAGFTKMNLFTGRTKAIGYLQNDSGQFDEIRPTYGAHGAAMMVKREIIENVGRFPEKFFLYYEEWDWSIRILNYGYKIYYQGLATVLHKESQSVGKITALKEYYLTRNRILFMRRNSNSFEFGTFILYFSIFTFPKFIIYNLRKGNLQNIKAFLKGIRDNFSITSSSPT